MKAHRIERINSLLIEVLNETLRKDVKNPHIHPMTTIVRVETTVDLRYAKVLVSVLADEAKQEETIKALNSAAGFIAVNSAKRVTLHFFPELQFRIDRSGEHAAHIDQLLRKVLPTGDTAASSELDLDSDDLDSDDLDSDDLDDSDSEDLDSDDLDDSDSDDFEDDDETEEHDS